VRHAQCGRALPRHVTGRIAVQGGDGVEIWRQDNEIHENSDDGDGGGGSHRAVRPGPGRRVKVRVPFDFVVADQVLPSGEYQFVQQQDPRLVRIYSKAHVPMAVATFLPTTVAPSGKATLVFHKYGTQRFLKSICDCGGSGAYLSKTRKERQAQMRGDSVLVATLQE
jgi:hypothetical protein